MSAQPSDFARPKRHTFVEQRGTDECGWCGMASGVGGLHTDDDPTEPTPDTSAFRPGDLIEHRLGSLFRAQLTSQGRIVFEPLGRIGPPQDEMPDGWTLLHREQT